MTDERIRTRCPSCGCTTLFVSPGGHITCSLIGCRHPGLDDAIDALVEKRINDVERRAVEKRDAEIAAWAKKAQHEYMDCSAPFVLADLLAFLRGADDAG